MKKKWFVTSGQWLVKKNTPSAGAPRRAVCPPPPPTVPPPTTNHQSPTTRRSAARHGVLLLVVLSILILFSLVAVTFVLVAGRYYDATRNAVRNEQVGDDPRQLLDEVFAQCIRGTTNPHSVLRGHSLLEDLYGNDGIRGQVDTVTTPVSGLLDLTVLDPPQSLLFYPDTSGVMQPMRTLAQITTTGQYNGCVLTMTTGNARGRSTRIVGWGQVGGTAGPLTARVLAFRDGIVPAQNDQFVINGRPFNGTGYGFNTLADPTAETLLNAEVQFGPVSVNAAYLTNPVYADPRHMEPEAQVINNGTDHEYTQFGGIGGADEDYDAPDVQNMLLAHVPIQINGGPGGQIIPSLHRPETYTRIRAIAQNDGLIGPGSRVLERMMLLRPHTHNTPNFSTHPQFPHMNPGGPYDVDNDGDGIAESIWVDAGLPVRTAADGRKFKPLVAILCLDMDGRLNVNAHGNVAHVDAYHNGPAGSPPPVFSDTGIVNGQFAGGAFPQLMRGHGYGPPEISLYPLFAPFMSSPFAPPQPSDNYRRLLAQRYSEPNTNLFDLARDTGYVPLYNSAPAATAGPMQKFAAQPGATGLLDPRAGLKFTHFPVPNAAPEVLSSFGSPPDLKGHGYVALDARGMPIFVYMNDLRDRDDSAYETDLSRRAIRDSSSPTATVSAVADPLLTPNPLDSLFTPAEMERILRMYDFDAAELPDRLRALLDGAGGPALALLRNGITTESFDLPTPAVLPTRDMRAQAGAMIISPSIADLLRVRMTAAGFTGDEDAFNTAVSLMLPPELVAGRRMDINRPFGNGRDDDGNGIVDEPGEAEAAIWNALNMSVPPRHTNAAIWPNLTNGIDMNADGVLDDADNLYVRQLYARYLYILMMLLKDQAYEFDADGDGITSPEETAIAIAQWAINVVDYRDRDSIMTPFKFNLYPFRDGWTADQDLSNVPPETAVVWGCERPELLITETLAFHDRRTEDLDTEVPAPPATMPGTTQPGPHQDEDFDQRIPPRGSLFVELYNPWTTQTSALRASGLPGALEAPGEFYDLDLNADTATGVDLRATTPGGYPVWRMLIVAGTETELVGTVQVPKDPDHPDLARRPAPASTERSIYFVEPPVTIADDGQKYFAGNTQTIAPLLPGRYAVVGSAGLIDGANYVTTIGRRAQNHPPGVSDAGQDGINALTIETRRIVLSPSADTTVPQVLVYDNSAADPAPTNFLPPIAAVIDKALDGGVPVDRSISVSEPPAGYANVVPGANEPLMASVVDVPLDNDAATNPAAPINSGLFRILYLQRLANPLEPHHPVTNPYRTIDTAPISMSVFNGVSPNEPGILHTGLASWQRGGPTGSGLLPADGSSMIWTYGPAQGSTTSGPDGGANAHNFSFTLEHSLGYLNPGYGRVGEPTETFTGVSTPLDSYLGSPNAKPFPWLTWNNRPYVSAAELMLVPKSRSSRLSLEYTPPTNQPYNQPATTQSHLLPFFQTTTAGQPLPNFQRVLDYVGVPSRFVGTETELDPPTMATAPGAAVDPAERWMMAALRPPFNQVSNYRDPGRVNINTIPGDTEVSASSLVWNGVLNRPETDVIPLTWQQIALNRLGASVPMIAQQVSLFANPFRSSSGESLMLPRALGASDREEVDVTLLRPTAPESNDPADTPLFGYASTATHNNTNRNAYFGHQNLQRLSNLLTTRSNVYAIWITVGYFEVQTPPRNSAGAPQASGPGTPYPDGYQLMQEMGSDTGEIVRHRAFYLYDRSIPVGFEPGKDHNFADGILLKRFIE